jgi:hypothetical protein
MALLKNIWKKDEGQDSFEDALLMASVALGSPALFPGAGSSVKAIWTRANTQLGPAASAANS